jgi:hypothetical protein
MRSERSRARYKRAIQQLIALGFSIDDVMQVQSECCRANGTLNINLMARYAAYLTEQVTEQESRDERTQVATREELAKRVRSVYLGEETPYHFYAPYKHLVTDEMVAASDAELQALSQALGPHVRGYRAEEAQAGAGRGGSRRVLSNFPINRPRAARARHLARMIFRASVEKRFAGINGSHTHHATAAEQDRVIQSVTFP